MPKVRRRATTQSRARFSPYHRQPRSSTREAKDELYSSTVAKQPISTHPPTNSAMYALTINALPTEIRQQIFLEYITTSSNDITMWHPPGARLFKFMVLVPCNVEWWLAGLRALKLLSTCKQWHVDMIFVFEHLSRQTELEYKQTFVASYINYHSEVVKVWPLFVPAKQALMCSY